MHQKDSSHSLHSLQDALVARNQAHTALDAFGYASIAVRLDDGRLLWETPLARNLLLAWFGVAAPVTAPEIRSWLGSCIAHIKKGLEPAKYLCEQGAKRLTLRLHQQIGDSDAGGDWLIVMHEASDTAVMETLRVTLTLTPKEAEVLYWVLKGKTNKDIADILGSSPMTVKKHLERIYIKLGVETRTAAAGVAMAKIRMMHPHWEG